MESFAINTKYVNIPEGENGFLNDGFKSIFSISSQKNKLEIHKGSTIVLIRPIANEFIFTNKAIIKDIKETTTESVKKTSTSNAKKEIPLENKYYHKFELEIVQKLENNNRLSDLKHKFIKEVEHFFPEQTFKVIG